MKHCVRFSTYNTKFFASSEKQCSCIQFSGSMKFLCVILLLNSKTMDELPDPKIGDIIVNISSNHFTFYQIF